MIQVLDASFFMNGFVVSSEDFIQVGNNTPVTVTEVDYTKKTITIDRNISWNKGDGVSYPYTSSSPDMGAYEFPGEDDFSPRPPSGWGITKR
jgi:hypothetical protein